jgi:subtilisin family serine protease
LAGGNAAAAGDAWGIAAVGADATKWTGDGVTVAVLDTSIDKDHPAFARVEFIEQDFSGSGAGDSRDMGRIAPAPSSAATSTGGASASPAASSGP